MYTSEKNIAEQIFNEFCELYKKRNLCGLLRLFTKNTNVWGSGLDEYRIGLKEIESQFKRDWSQSEQAAIEVVSFVPASQSASWVAAICNARITIDGKEYLFEHLRGTIVIEKEDGMWKIAHMHSSFPDFRNSDNASFPTA